MPTLTHYVILLLCREIKIAPCKLKSACSPYTTTSDNRPMIFNTGIPANDPPVLSVFREAQRNSLHSLNVFIVLHYVGPTNK